MSLNLVRGSLYIRRHASTLIVVMHGLYSNKSDTTGNEVHTNRPPHSQAVLELPATPDPSLRLDAVRN
jgi:hypothetical protein